MMNLNTLFKNTSYDTTMFSDDAVSAIEASTFMKKVKDIEIPYIKCIIRGKDIKLTPEEAVRQLYVYTLVHQYGYPTTRIQLETPIHFGREVKRADIAIMDKDRPMVPYIIVELKKPKLTDGKEQLKSYCNATGAPIGVWTNGEQISCYNRKDPNFFEEITDIPKATQKLSDIITKGGRVGTAGLITKPSYVTRDLIFINSSTMSRKDYVALYMFFASNFAYKQMIRSSSMTAQPHLTITLVRDLLVYNYSDDFKKEIEKYYTQIEKLKLKSEFEYLEAEQLLKKSLNIDEFAITKSPISIKNKKSSFDISGRFDAEYYHPKYDTLFSTLSKHKTIPLGGSKGLVSIKKSIEPGSEAYLEEGIPFIRVSDVEKYDISPPTIMLSKNIVPNIEDLYPKRDTILLSKDGRKQATCLFPLILCLYLPKSPYTLYTDPILTKSAFKFTILRKLCDFMDILTKTNRTPT